MGRKLRKPLSFPLEKIWSLKKIPLERGPSSSSGCSKKSAHKQYETAMFCREVLLSRQNFSCQKDKHQVCLVSSRQCDTMQIHVSSRELLILIYSWVNFLMSTWMYHDFNIRHFRMRTLDLNPKTKINYKVTFQIPWYPLTQSIKRIVIMKLKARGRYFPYLSLHSLQRWWTILCSHEFLFSHHLGLIFLMQMQTLLLKQLEVNTQPLHRVLFTSTCPIT